MGLIVFTSISTAVYEWIYSHADLDMDVRGTIGGNQELQGCSDPYGVDEQSKSVAQIVSDLFSFESEV